MEGIVRFYAGFPICSGEQIANPHVSWVFLQFAHFPIFGRGATCPPYDLKSQKGQIEGIFRFYAASATCQGDKLKWTPTCQGTNCGARMFPGFLLNLSLFLSPALGQLGVGPLRPASGMTLSPAGSGAVCQWQTSSTDRRGSGDRPLGNVPPGRSGPQRGSQVSPPPLGEVSCLWHDGEGNLPTARTCVSDSHRRGVQPPVSPAGSVGPGRSPLGTRTPKARLAPGGLPG